MGSLSQIDLTAFDLGVEAVGRYYWDYTVDNEGQWNFVNSQEGFQGIELWVLLGNIHSFDQRSLDELYGYMQNSTYRAKARELISGQTNGQDIRNGFSVVGRPINWGNNDQINENALRRLVAAKESNRLETNTSWTGTFYEAEGSYVYEVWSFLQNNIVGSFVLWSYGQEQCLSGEGPENMARIGCRKCTGTRANPGTCE